MHYDFKGKVALVTGAGSGIGKAMAAAFSDAGAALVVSDINAGSGAATASEIGDSGGNAVFVQTDVSDQDQVDTLIKTCTDTYGRLDFACNNAGVLHAGTETAQIAPEDWDHLMSVNLRGVWSCMRREIPVMLEQELGAIVNTASVAGLVGVPGAACYAATKWGVVGLTKSAALDYAGQGLRINAVCPGVADTPMIQGTPVEAAQAVQAIPMGRMARPVEIAPDTLWMCSDQASYVNGHAMVVDGGYSVP